METAAVRATALVQQTWVKSAEAFWRLIKKPCSIHFKDARKTFFVWSSPVPSSGYLDHAPQEGTAVSVKARWTQCPQRAGETPFPLVHGS